jgi:alpha-glucosidase (family GH31 glycosyl hydrolase)
MTKNTLFPAIALTTTIASTSLVAHAAPQNPIVVGAARFTVLTPNCIRLEYAQNGKFVDSPSLFAINRKPTFTDFKVGKDGKATVIDTGKIRLTYNGDGTPFSEKNLSAAIRGDATFGTKRWTPASRNSRNLGGTTRTLDGVTGPVDVGHGVVSRDGWYLLDDSGAPLLKGDWVEARPQNSGTDWYLFGYGHDYRAALRSLTAVGGRVPLPRRSVLGTWYSRYWNHTSDDFRRIAQEYRQKDFPLDVMVLDMDWHRDGWTGWSWNRDLIPDPAKLMSDLHAEGLQTTLNLHPADGVAPHEDRYKEFMAAIGEPADGKTVQLDVANQKHMNALGKEVMGPLKKDGVDFWWLDWQQYPQTRSIPSLTNLWWFNEFLMRDTSVGGRRGVAFSRWAGWGDHRHPIHFSGDASTTFEMLAFEVPYTTMAGNVGCFFWSHDIGGHQGSRNDESYARWCQFGAFTAALRSHSTRDAKLDRRPWTYEPWAEKSMRTSFHIRSEMFPYIYTSTAQSTRDSVPLTRPLYIDFPADEASYHNAQEYLFGDNLLVAPIASKGVGAGRVAHQSVYFPQGTWFNTFTGERYSGGTEALCAGTIDEFPLFAKAGVPIPMQPYTQRMTSTPISTLRLRVFPGEDGQVGRSHLYEDDGDSNTYKNGAYAVTDLRYSRTGNAIEVAFGATKGKFKGQLAARAYKIELPATQRATSATLNGVKLPVSYDVNTMTNVISVPARSITQPGVVKVTVADADFDTLTNRAQANRMQALTGRTFSPQSPRTLLKQAMASNLTSEQITEALAIVGVGVVRKNLSPTFMNGEVRDVVYSPEGVLDDAPKVSTVSRSRVTIKVDGRDVSLPNALLGSDNIASKAKITVSGVENGYGSAGATDGIIGGYPTNRNAEWASGQKDTSSIRLTWDTAQTIDRVALFDRVNTVDHITSGVLRFSDGTSIPVGALENDASSPTELRFAPKTVTWVEFQVQAVTGPTEGSGLAEIAVFKTN